MLQFQNICMCYPSATGPIEALSDINIDVKNGEFISILGPSGCGKSTLLLIAARLVPQTTGNVCLHSQSISKPLQNVGFVFQDHLLLEWRTVLSNILIQGEFRNIDREMLQAKAEALIELVGLKGFENKYPHELSGGMQQRVAICRALVHDPEILMMDEPFGALDALTREQIRIDLERIWLEKKNTVLFVTHDINEAILLSDRVIVMSPRPGKIHAEFTIDLPRPRRLRITETEEFIEYKKKITGIFLEMGILRE